MLTFIAGKTISNFTAVVPPLAAGTEARFTVPAAKKWICLGLCYIERDASATLDISLHDTDDNKVADLITQVAAGTTNLFFPESIAATAGDLETWKMLKGMLLTEGWYVKVVWGAAQTTPERSFPVIVYPA